MSKEDLRLKALSDLEGLLSQSGFSMRLDNKTRRFFKQYITAKYGKIEISPLFTNDPDSKNYKVNVDIKVGGVMITSTQTKKFKIIDIPELTNMSELSALPRECLFDLSTLIIKTSSNITNGLEETYIITKDCIQCGTNTRSFISLEAGITCLECARI
jgi:hypothetical protein